LHAAGTCFTLARPPPAPDTQTSSPFPDRSAVGRFLTAPLRLGRYFNKEGTATYPDESERLRGSGAKRTERLLARARSRGAILRLTYSLSLTVSVAALCLPAQL